MTLQELKARAADIYEMNMNEVEEFGTKVSMSDLDAKAKYFLYRALEDRQLQIIDMKSLGCEVVSSEVLEGEL